MKIWSIQYGNRTGVFVNYIRKENNMKKYDKEYSTQYVPEMKYLKENGIQPAYVKIINDVTTYKYTKTPELFKLLVIFYSKK